jgi:crotonobetainyl-CoA:carnitine CoA-transferase CaiB-like acyl-CoA transferase
MSAENQTQEGALSGFKVLDLSRVLAGPWCGMLLGDMGAEVVKVESPKSGDDTRAWGPPFLEGESSYYLGCNRNKRGITIDFSQPEGKELLAKLIPHFDVVLENFKNGTLEKWGFDSAWFETHAPRVVRCSITGYGTQGPLSQLPGYDFILQAESGLMSICGEQNGDPSKYGVAIVDLATGMMAANVIQGALLARYRTGKGQHVEVALYDTSIALLANVGSSHLATGKDARRFGNGHPTIVPYTTFQAADKLIALAVGNDSQFAKLAEILGHPEWVSNEKYRTNTARITHREEVDGMVAVELKKMHSQELIPLLRQHGIPIGPVNSVAEALAAEHTLARQMIVSHEHPTIGDLKTLGTPLKMHQTPTAVRYPPPRLGEHTQEVLAEYLDQHSIDQLLAKKVIA